MAKYIEYEKAIEEIKKYVIDVYDTDLDDYENWENGAVKYILEGLYEAVERLDEVPAADVVKLRHGEWHTQLVSHHNTFNAYLHICKECGYFYKDTRPNEHNYCPNCGTKMDGIACGEEKVKEISEEIINAFMSLPREKQEEILYKSGLKFK